MSARLNQQVEEFGVSNNSTQLPESTILKHFTSFGDQFLKHNFVPFLSYTSRTNLRATCKLIEGCLSAPNWNSFLWDNGSMWAEARHETFTGCVETRGCRIAGGDSSSVSKELRSNVLSVIQGVGSFVAIKPNGKVIAWGGLGYGLDSSSVDEDLESGVVEVVFNCLSWSALKETGKVVCWGYLAVMGKFADVSEQLQSGVVKIEAEDEDRGFRATKSDGTQITWCD